jgi:2-methylcitrate dehydratase PrpD
MLTSRYGSAVAGFASRALATDLSADVERHARNHIIDTLGAIVSGSMMSAGRAAQRYVQMTGGQARASVIGTRLRAPLIEAALANGMSAHADESDDSHQESMTHPGCGVLPAALAIGESTGASGRDVMRAVVLGYEMCTRFASAFGADMSSKRASLASHSYGPLFGAGYAAGALLKFDEEKFAILLNYLSQEASGLTTWRLDSSHTLKSYAFAGMSASNGVKAAMLVHAGFTGSGDVLDASRRSMLECITANPRPDALIDGLGEQYAIVRTDIKYYSVGYPIAAPVAAIEKILALDGFTSDQVERVKLRYHRDWYAVVGDLSRMPDVNLRHCLAVTLLDGRLTFDAAHDKARMHAEDVVQMGKRIEFLEADADLDYFAVRVEIEAGGKTWRTEQGKDVPGRIENPMSNAQIRDKARQLMTPVLGTSSVERVIGMLDELESLRDIGVLIDAICRHETAQ